MGETVIATTSARKASSRARRGATAAWIPKAAKYADASRACAANRSSPSGRIAVGTTKAVPLPLSARESA